MEQKGEGALEFRHGNDQSIKSLVDIGAKGLFPLFEKEWIREVRKNNRQLTGNEKAKAKVLFKRIGQYRSLERKKTVLISLEKKERLLFVRAFMKMVENRILDLRPHLQ